MPKKILVIRNDKLGDFMLTYPSFSLLKQSLPDTEIVALVSRYTEPMATTCQWIDRIVIAPDSSIASLSKFVRALRNENFDSAITLFSTTRIGLALRLSGIPYRLAPATKIAQIFYNNRLTQRRSLSEKPEHEYNTDLIRHFLTQHYIDHNVSPEPPYLKFDDQHIQQKKQKFREENDLKLNGKLVFLHPGSGGSANNLQLDQFAKLATLLTSNPNNNDTTIIITAGPNELDKAEKLSKKLQGVVAHRIYHSQDGLINFSQHIQFCDLFISGSTGTLHIAGALDVPTVGFYPKRRSATPLRWQTLNSPKNRLAITPNSQQNESDMESIDMTESANKIRNYYPSIFGTV